MIQYIIIGVLVYMLFILFMIRLFQVISERPSEPVSKEVLEKLAGERYRIVPNKAYRKKMIKEYMEQGISKIKIAKKLGITRQRLYQILEEEKIW